MTETLHTADSYEVDSAGSASVTVTDNDIAPALELVLDKATVEEGRERCPDLAAFRDLRQPHRDMGALRHSGRGVTQRISLRSGRSGACHHFTE